MDTSSTSPRLAAIDIQTVEPPTPDPQFDTEPVADKISAYYSLVFPNYTFYLQTLTVTIGRRSVRPGVASTSESPQVDVDLGPLKNVSRLHARIEYEESSEQFVLAVLGRNGAWVDGVWSGSGSRVPLSSRSQIQIASRVFHFVLPPTPVPVPEDSPTPSSPASSIRQLSPSIDVTSLSPDSSLPSPPAPTKELPTPAPAPTKHPQEPATQPVKSQTKQTTKKRKKPGSEPRPLPEVMPSRPPFTYAQLCYRAIKSMDGKATLQEICTWVSDNFDWYYFNEGSGWDSSIRHNLSANKAFKKMERCAGERGKGFFWSVDPEYEHTFEDQEGRGNKDGVKNKNKGGKGTSLLEPPLKRSVKGESKTPLPPPLTSTPLPAFTSSPLVPRHQAVQKVEETISTTTAVPSAAPEAVRVKQEPVTQDPILRVLPLSTSGLHSTTVVQPQSTSQLTPASPVVSPPELSEDVIVPIVIGPPSPTMSTPDGTQSKSSIPDLSSRAIVLKDNTIILSPTIFSSLTQEQLKELEALGARKAIEILRSYIVRFLKEKIRTEGAKGKGKKRSKKDKAKKDGDNKLSSGQTSDVATNPPVIAEVTSSQTKNKNTLSVSGPFTTAPLPQRKPIERLVNPTSTPQPPTPAQVEQPPSTTHAPVSSTTNGLRTSMDALSAPIHHMEISPPPMARLEGPMEQISITDDDDEPAAKKPRLDIVENMETMETIEVV